MESDFAYCSVLQSQRTIRILIGEIIKLCFSNYGWGKNVNANSDSVITYTWDIKAYFPQKYFDYLNKR
jgi:hypothetical protein